LGTNWEKIIYIVIKIRENEKLAIISNIQEIIKMRFDRYDEANIVV